jgi:hypothetical protein
MSDSPSTSTSRIAQLSLACIGVAALALTSGYALGTLWGGAVAVAALGALWALQQWRGREWASSAGLAAVVTAAAGGFLLGVQTGWLLAGVVAALTAWDLDQFELHLRQAGQVLGRPEMERRHLGRLVLADTIGLVLAIVALHLQFRFSFFATLFLAALLTLSVSELILYLRKGHEG